VLDLPRTILPYLTRNRQIPQPAGPLQPDAALCPEAFLSLDAAMKEHIERVLTHTAGRSEGRHGAAKLLSINPHTLRARMRKLKIDWSQYRPE